MTKDTEVVMLERLETLQESMDRIDKDLERDREEAEKYRKDVQEHSMRMGALEGQVDELRKNLKNLENKITNRVAETIEPLREEIEHKQIVEYRPKFRWKFWKRR